MPAGTVGGRIAATKNPRSSSRRLASTASSAPPSSTGWIGVSEGASGRPASAASRRKRCASASTRTRRQDSATDDLERGARRRRDRDRQRRRINVGARALDQRLDEVRVPGDEGAEAAEGLAERADERRHVARA